LSQALAREPKAASFRVFLRNLDTLLKNPARAVIPSPFAVILRTAKSFALPLRRKFANDLALSG
jgi:hypothetical protein